MAGGENKNNEKKKWYSPKTKHKDNTKNKVPKFSN